LSLRPQGTHDRPETCSPITPFLSSNENLIGGRACRVTATIQEAKDKMKASGFEPLVFEDAQDLLLDQLGAIHGRDRFLQ